MTTPGRPGVKRLAWLSSARLDVIETSQTAVPDELAAMVAEIRGRRAQVKRARVGLRAVRAKLTEQLQDIGAAFTARKDGDSGR